jgi:hypothetical protein
MFDRDDEDEDDGDDDENADNNHQDNNNNDGDDNNINNAPTYIANVELTLMKSWGCTHLVVVGMALVAC